MRLRSPLILVAAASAFASCGGGDGGHDATYSADTVGRCFEKAGATLATKRGDLDFARGISIGTGLEVDAAGELPDGAPTGSVKTSKGGGWRIYYAHPGGLDSLGGLDSVVRDPSRVRAVAFVKPDDASKDDKVSDCLDGTLVDG